MNPELFSALTQERSIFRVFNAVFNAYETIASFEAFHSPSLTEVPHWNMTYPTSAKATTGTTADLLELDRHYRNLGVTGHLATADIKYEKVAVEEPLTNEILSYPLA